MRDILKKVVVKLKTEQLFTYRLTKKQLREIE